MLRTKKQAEAPARKSNIHKNDQVVVISGKDRGKKGKVLRVLPSKGRAIVERVNFNKKHTKKNPSKNQQGGILEREAPMRLSNLMVICPACDAQTRVGASVAKDGSRTRVCKKCGAELSK